MIPPVSTHMDRRRNPRITAMLPVRVWGVDARALPFMQLATVRNISSSGVVVQGIRRRLLPGVVLEVERGDDKARCRNGGGSVPRPGSQRRANATSGVRSFRPPDDSSHQSLTLRFTRRRDAVFRQRVGCDASAPAWDAAGGTLLDPATAGSRRDG